MLLSLFILTNLKRLRCRGVAILDVELIFARFHVGNVYKIRCNILHSLNHSLLAVEDHHLCRILRGQSEADARIVRIERNAGLFKSVGIVDGQLRDVLRREPYHHPQRRSLHTVRSYIYRNLRTGFHLHHVKFYVERAIV